VPELSTAEGRSGDALVQDSFVPCTRDARSLLRLRRARVTAIMIPAAVSATRSATTPSASAADLGLRTTQAAMARAAASEDETAAATVPALPAGSHNRAIVPVDVDIPTPLLGGTWLTRSRDGRTPGSLTANAPAQDQAIEPEEPGVTLCVNLLQQHWHATTTRGVVENPAPCDAD